MGYYVADYSSTEFKIHKYNDWWVDDYSWYDQSREESRKNFDRIVNEIEAACSGAIASYDKVYDGQKILFNKCKIKDIY